MHVHVFLSLAVGWGVPAFAVLRPVTDIRIVNRDISPDGFKRQAVLADGTFPAPLIVAEKGDRFLVNVIDELTNHTMLKSTSIHWHGMFQRGTNWADGAAFVNQCPITSGHSFLYDFSAGQQAGTFWYHSHLKLQYCDGLRGPLVIKDPHDPNRHLYDVDNENTVITLADWYHTAVQLIVGLPEPQSTLINGRGRYPGGPKAPLTVFDVHHDKRYRFRLVSMACGPNFVFSIDGHEMTIIEVEGTSSKPHTVDSIQIFAAQRYSFVLHANKPIGNYWIRAQPNIDSLEGFDGGINSAILRYVGAPDKEPTSQQTPSVIPLNEVDLHPLTHQSAPGVPIVGHVDKAINLVLGFNETTGMLTIDGVPFIPPSVPVLLQILSHTKEPQQLLPAGSVIPLPRNAVVEVSLPVVEGAVAISGPHPFHLHGHKFSVVRSAGSEIYNFRDPIARDTVSIGNQPGRDNVTIRFETFNPGPWIFHCHIDFHLDIGFAVVFAEESDRVALTDPAPEAWKNLCPLYDALDPSNT